MDFPPEIFFDAWGSGTFMHQQPSILLLITFVLYPHFMIILLPLTFGRLHFVCLIVYVSSLTICTPKVHRVINCYKGELVV